MQAETLTGAPSVTSQPLKSDYFSSPSSTSNTNATSNSNSALSVEIQAQFELSVELRRFINIDLFQRGYYQIRLSIKCANKQMLTKIFLTLENSQSNNNLSGMALNIHYRVLFINTD